MSNQTAAIRFSMSTVWIAIASLVVALFLPILTATQDVQAAQILDRYIHMDSSAAGVETVYTAEFQVPSSTTTVDSIRVEFCNESPLPGTDCSVSTVSGDNVPDLDASAGNVITVTDFQFGTAGASIGTPGTDNTTECTGGSLQAVGAGDNYFDYECDVAEAITPGTDDYVFIEVTDVNNPTNTTSGVNNDSFYARIYVWESGPADAYVQATPPQGDHNGGVALSTAEQITVEARVQETLTFTVGVDDEADDCAAVAGSTVELGVLGAGINYASADGFDQVTPNTDVACAEVTTNAANGVSVYYVGDNLAVGSTVCADGNTDVNPGPAVTTDQCINRGDDADADGTITAGTEQWGMAISASVENGSITNTMTAEAPYDLDIGDEYSFTPNAVTLLATSSSVLDQAAIEVDMAGTASITTPTGVYDTTLTFIATAQF